MTSSLRVIPVPGLGAEDVLVVPSGPDEGTVYTGTEDGTIWRISPDGGQITQVAATGGRPLGIELDVDGRLLVCDADRGLLRVDTGSGVVEPVTDGVAGRRMRFCNNAAVAPDGTIWFSDSSAHYGIEEWRTELAEDTRSGRLLRMDTDGTLTVVLDGLSFANGVALGTDEAYVAVAETGSRTVVRLWLTGERAGTRDLFASDLPGYPDNIARGTDGLIWMALTSRRQPLIELLRRGPGGLARTASRIPLRLQPQPQHVVLVRAYDDAGMLVHDIDLSTPDFHMVTGVREHNGRLWLGSLLESAVAVLDLPPT